MTTPNEPSAVSGVFRRPFDEQVAFFRARLANLVPTQRWDDIRREAHDSSFVVAGATKASLLADLAAAVDRSISEGQSLEQFRRDFRDTVQRHGWHNWTGEGSVAGEAWRTRVIYTTNARTSYAAGRRAQIREGGFAYRVYRHGGSAEPRPQHLAWDGLTLPADHPFWDTHAPPNGWGCSCYELGARSESGARRLGGNPDKALPADWDATEARTGAPPGIDRGWDYAPGDSVQDAVRAARDTLARLPAPLSAAVIRDWQRREIPLPDLNQEDNDGDS
ncbi:phage minor head protein [Halomonas pacifica]|uniref:phage head morphogenesis protein n=1 Tax=Bisbaumannia pacifica TaxID=77098 RepID=UPI0023594819|nr:phage minor head protein [Halomonas pacifica]MDC8804225.1 phage minor head protein [Halomonas pacifica]